MYHVSSVCIICIILLYFPSESPCFIAIPPPLFGPGPATCAGACEPAAALGAGAPGFFGAGSRAALALGNCVRNGVIMIIRIMKFFSDCNSDYTGDYTGDSEDDYLMIIS